MASPLKVIFLGTSAFAVPSLRALAGDPRFKVELVITQPDRPVGRKQILTPPPVKVAAKELGLPIFQPENINRAIGDKRLAMSPDFLVVVSYGQILSGEILNWAKIAPINVHASLLPKYRGASPIQHAILAGDGETGVTIQKMARELDSGPVLNQERAPIGERETFTQLHEKLASIGAALLLKTLTEPFKELRQDESKATFCKKLTRADGEADPNTMAAETIDCMVRALNPWPGVTLKGNKILETSLAPHKDALTVACARNTTLSIMKIQPPSGKPMSGQAFALGHQI
ncbi:MAG: methionyl-tRNA formyltransferase [Candidatus Peribacteraceae bacterium]